MITIDTLTVAYNRIQNAWEVRGGEETQLFPAGLAGRQAAVRFAIACQYPEIAQAAERLSGKHEQATSRVWDGAYLLIAGHVLIPGVDADDNCVARVVSQQGSLSPRHYYIAQLDYTLACNCPDYSNGGVTVSEHILCKHILAYRLGRYLEWSLREKAPARLQPRKTAGGHWRGRTATRVNGRATANDAAQAAAEQSAATYVNGESVSEVHRPLYQTFTAAMRTAPFSEEKLLSWYYGR